LHHHIRRFLFAVAVTALPALAAQPLTSAPSQSLGATASASLVPSDSDEYATFVQRAEAGATDIDFRAMRLAYVKSAAFQRAGAALEQLQALRKEMFSAMNAREAVRVKEAARRIMSVVYIDLEAQKALRQSCKVLKEEACATRYHDLQFGLLKSILATGDGKSCSTAWEVVTLEEEYFILRMVGFTLKTQEGPNGSEICDKMIGVGEDGKGVTFYFGIKPIVQGYQR
jgi:Domain of unknown function (DUF4919)